MKTEAFENCRRFQSKSGHLSKMTVGLLMSTHAQSQVTVVSSFPSVLVWIGENDTKTLKWMKIFCFVFAQVKKDSFEKVLNKCAWGFRIPPPPPPQIHDRTVICFFFWPVNACLNQCFICFLGHVRPSCSVPEERNQTNFI